MPSPENPSRGSRYEAAVATFIAVLAVAVSAYTAYVQRQQVRAQVWPVLEFTTGNEPEIDFSLANKGVGPALIRHAIVSVDGTPVPDWNAAMTALLGPGKHFYSWDLIGNRVLAAGERLPICVAHFEEGRKDPLFARLDKERFRLGVEICFCSTLGDCWTLEARAKERPQTRETGRCPAPSAATFNQ